MTGPTDFPEPQGMGRPPNEGTIALKDRLPLGVALLALIVAIAALVVAVGDSDSDDDAVDEAEASATTSAPAATAPPPIPTTTLGTVQTLPPPSTTAASQQIVTATTAAESGEMMDEGEDQSKILSVVGIGYDSTLNVREEPGGQIVGKLDSTATGIVPTGLVQVVADVVWHEVHAAGVIGWVSAQYVTPLGATADATSEIVARLGETPSAANMAALGRTVAGAVASEEPESRVRISGEPKVGELSAVTMDVVGQPDDSIRGFRLQVFATRNSDGTFTLRNVEGTVMCYIDRGVNAGGLCN